MDSVQDVSFRNESSPATQTPSREKLYHSERSYLFYVCIRSTLGLLGVVQADVVVSLLLSEQPLGLEGGHASGSSRGDGLLVPLVLHVSGREHTHHARLRRSGDGEDVAVRVGLDLLHEEGRGRDVTDGVEESVDGEGRLLLRLVVEDGKTVEEVAVTKALSRLSLERKGDWQGQIGAEVKT